MASGRADAGLLIHEGQLTFSELGLSKVLDLGEWWLLETGLPLPLGVNVARRDVERLHDLSAVLREAIACGLEHRDEALDYALEFGRGIDAAVADRFVSMYVNELTQDYGDEGRSAVTELLRRGEAMGAFPGPVSVDWIASISEAQRRSVSAAPAASSAMPRTRGQSSATRSKPNQP